MAGSRNYGNNRHDKTNKLAKPLNDVHGDFPSMRIKWKAHVMQCKAVQRSGLLNGVGGKCCRRLRELS